MSLLYRFTKLQDRADTHVFTFVVTRSVTRDLERDVTSKEFTAGHHRWAITFSRNDKVLGVYLVWRSASEGIRVSADFAFTLLNREHFSANEAFSGRQVKFTAGCPAQGNRNYIPVNDLYGRNFTDSHGEFQLELSIGNVRTLFDTHIRTQQTLFFGLGVGGGGGGGNKSDSETHQHTNHHHHKHQRHHKHQQQQQQPPPPPPQQESGSRPGSSRHSSPRRSGGQNSSPSEGGGGAPGEDAAAAGRRKKQSLTKYETAHFTFGGFDWNVCVYPTGDGSPAAEEGRGTSGRRRGGSSSGRMSVYLNRLTGFDHQCRLRYSLSLGEGDRRLDSGPVEDHSDAEGRGLGWHPRARISDLVSRRGGGGGGALLRVRLEMIEARTLSEVAIAAAGLSGGLLSPGIPTCVGNTLRPVSPSPSSYSIAASPLSSCAPPGILGGATSPSSPSAALHGLHSNANSPPGGAGSSAGPCSSQCYDRDKQAWIIRTDTHSETVRLHMVFKDVQNVPRNHLRYVCWTAYLLRYHHKTGLVEPVALPGGPFSHYYAQDVSDEGIIMETDIPVKEMREPDCPYLTEKGQVRVRVEWGECHLLFQATYHKYDDVSRIHNHQMRREISALQAENYSLERQLFSYQKSIAYAHSRGASYPDELASPSQDVGDYARRGVGEGEEGNGGGGGGGRVRSHRRRRRLCGGEGGGGGVGGVGPVEGDEDDDEEYYDEEGGGGGGRAYSLGDRSLSTDTEYA